jgi:hypothetical protein
LPTQATPWYQFVGSGGIDLSKYTGKINIAFKYTGSGKIRHWMAAFQVDDVQCLEIKIAKYYIKNKNY